MISCVLGSVRARQAVSLQMRGRSCFGSKSTACVAAALPYGYSMTGERVRCGTLLVHFVGLIVSIQISSQAFSMCALPAATDNL
jgi:hypothetical protein